MEQKEKTEYHVNEFLEQGRYLRSWSPTTLRSYQQCLTALTTTLNGTSVSKSSLQDFVVAMRQKGLTPGGCNVRIRTVNSYLTWLHSEGHTPERLRVKVLRSERKTPLTVGATDIRKLVAFRPRCRSAQRAWVLCVVLLDTGLRIDEALGLERKSVDLDNLYLKVLGKGSKERLVPISTEGRRHLFRWLREPNGRFVFATRHGARLSYRNAYRDMNKLCAGLGFTIHPHGFRHSFAVNYIQRGGDIYRLSRILGHASISTTELYLRSMGIDALREGHDSLSTLGG